MKKVLITHKDFKNRDYFGGVANFYKTIFKEFKRIQPTSFIVGTRHNRIEKNPIRILKRLIVDYINFNREIQETKYDIILFNPSISFGSALRDLVNVLLAIWHGVPFVVFFRGWHVKFEKFIDFGFKWVFRHTFFRADKIIVLSSHCSDKIKKWGFEKQISILTTTVDDIYLKRISFKEIISVKKKGFIQILFLGSLLNDKGIFIAIDAFFELASGHDNVKMVIAGEGQERSKVISQISSHPEIEYVGFIRDKKKHEIMMASDLYILPSYHEGLPNSVLEAMAYAMPVITRPVGGIPDFFVNEKMGYMTESTDPLVYSNMMEKLLDEEMRTSISKFNYQYAKDKFYSSKVSEKIEDLLIYQSE